jgi:tRNA (mo5U34)-methyltransferase
MSANFSARHARRNGGPTVRHEIAHLAPWFHNLHLPDGTETRPDHPYGDFPAFKWRLIAPHLPRRLGGWRALDIGCNAGFYSIELARRGASVTAIDIDPHYLEQARWAAAEFGVADRIEFREGQVYDLAREPGRYDLVLFMGVLYHLRYPMLGLDIVAEKVGRLLVFQTLTMPGMAVTRNTRDREIEDRDDLLRPGWPKLAFVEHRFAGDPTNWWIPNHAAVEAMLRSSGLGVIDRLGHEIYLCRPRATRRSPLSDLLRRELAAATGRE